MSIEAMKLALAALAAGTDQDLIGNARIALHAAIQQAEAPQPDTGEPVCPACHGSGEGSVLSGGGPDAYDVLCACQTCSGTGEIYTHPAPGVPDAVVRDAVEELHKLNEYTIVHINDPEWTRVSDTCQKLIGAFDAAMLTSAQAQKGQG